MKNLSTPNDRRLQAIWTYLKNKKATQRSIDKVCEITEFHAFFIERIAKLVKLEIKTEKCQKKIPDKLLTEIKTNGFGDKHISHLTGISQKKIRDKRKKLDIISSFLMVDTCAGEFEAKTPYFYSTYADNKEPIKTGKSIVILGSGPIMQQVLKAAEILSNKGIPCRVWSVTSYGELYRKSSEFDRIQRLTGYQSESIYSILEGSDDSVVVAASDNIRAVPELIRPWVLGRYIVLGTDGFGRSDTRTALRRFFEVDSEHIVLAALAGLVQKGTIDIAIFDAIKQEFGIDVEREDITSI